MRKYLSLALALFLVVSLAACSDKTPVDDGSALETADNIIDVTNNGGSIDMNEDTAKTILAIYTPEQLRLKDTIDMYSLVISATKYNGAAGCKVEAFADGAKEAEGVFMIIGTDCYVFDVAQNKYVPIIGKSNSPATQQAGESTTANIPDDPEITFQYHKENNYLMRQKFSAYDIAALGLEKAVEEYVFVVNGVSAYAVDGEMVYIVEVYKKNGEKVDVRVAFSEDAEYIYNEETKLFEKLEK